MKMNICLLLSESFDPDMPARPEVTEVYGECFPNFGHKITWIMPSNKKEGKIEQEFFKQVCIYTIPRFSGLSLPLKIFYLISYYVKIYRLLTKLHEEEQIDIVQVRNDIFCSLLALRFKKRYNIPFVFEYSFPIVLYGFHKPKKHYLLYFWNFQRFITQYILRKSDFILPISEWMEEDLAGNGIPKSKMMPLPLGVNPKAFSLSKDGVKIRKKYGLSNAKIILYIGSMDVARKLDVIIHAFSKIKQHQNNFKLLMVGDGNDKSNLEKLAISLGIQKDVVFTGQVSYFDMPDFIAASDICLCPVPPLAIYKVSSPTKLFEYMVMQKPVVANEEIPEQKKVIERSGGGILVKFDAVSFAEGIMALFNYIKRTYEMGRKGYEWVVKNRTYKNMAREVEKKYYEILEMYNEP